MILQMELKQSLINSYLVEKENGLDNLGSLYFFLMDMMEMDLNILLVDQRDSFK